MAVQYREYPSTDRVRRRLQAPDLRREEQSTEKRKSVPGLQLDKEQDRARLFGEKYLPTFIDNLRYYAAETYGKVPVSVYEHTLIPQTDGSIRLAYPHSGELARESYMKPLEDPTLPDWYLERVKKDITYITRLEEELLPHLEVGAIVCNPSPASLEVSIEERKERQMGNQSFLFMHQVALNSEGKKTLRSVAFRNYLNLQQQAELYKELTGEEVAVNDLLGQIAVVKPDAAVTDLSNMEQLEAFHQALAQRYLEADPTERIAIPEEDTLTWSDDEVKRTMDELKPLLIALFHLIQYSDNKRYIADQFEVWGQVAKKMIRNEEVSDQEKAFFTRMDKEFLLRESYRMLQNQTRASIGDVSFDVYRNAMHAFDPRAQLLVAARTSMDTNSCGFGIGFGSEAVVAGIAAGQSQLTFFAPNGTMTNETASAYKADGIHEACVKCPCKDKNGNPCKNEKNNKMVVKGGKIVKYICGSISCSSNIKAKAA